MLIQEIIWDHSGKLFGLSKFQTSLNRTGIPSPFIVKNCLKMNTTTYMKHLVNTREIGHLICGWFQEWIAQFDCSGWTEIQKLYEKTGVGLHRSLKVRSKKLVCSESRWEFVCLPEMLTVPLHSYVWKECITDLFKKINKRHLPNASSFLSGSITFLVTLICLVTLILYPS